MDKVSVGATLCEVQGSEDVRILITDPSDASVLAGGLYPTVRARALVRVASCYTSLHAPDCTLTPTAITTPCLRNQRASVQGATESQCLRPINLAPRQIINPHCERPRLHPLAERQHQLLSLSLVCQHHDTVINSVRCLSTRPVSTTQASKCSS